MWLEIAAGEPRDLVADAILSGVEGKLASDLPQLSLARLEGRVGWHDDPFAPRSLRAPARIRCAG